jgi:hypothetical protein
MGGIVSREIGWTDAAGAIGGMTGAGATGGGAIGGGAVGSGPTGMGCCAAW